MNGTVGAGFVDFCGSVSYYSRYVRLNDDAPVFSAELVAIFKALEWVDESGITSFFFVSD